MRLFHQIREHIKKWQGSDEASLHAEELDRHIHDVLGHVVDLENKLEDFFDRALKGKRQRVGAKEKV